MVSEESTCCDAMIDRNWVTKRKRKQIKPGSNLTNGKEGPTLSSGSPWNNSSLKKFRCDKDIAGFSHKIRGKDGYFYECVECDLGGSLLCCDSCPRVYHLECLNPPLKRAPPGKWHCSKCCEKKDEEKGLGSLEGTLMRSRQSDTYEKPKVSNNKLGDKETLLSGKDHIKGNKGKSSILSRSSFGKALDSFKVDKTSSTEISYSCESDTREENYTEIENKIDKRSNKKFDEEKNLDPPFHSNVYSRKKVQTSFKTSNSILSGQSSSKKDHLTKTEVAIASILQSTKKCSKIKKKNKKTDMKKRSKAEKSKTSAPWGMDGTSSGTPQTSASLKKRKSLGHDHGASNKYAKMQKSATCELSEISPEKATPSQGLEDGVLQYLTAIQQVDRILGCRLQATRLISNETFKSVESPINIESENKEEELSLPSLNTLDKDGKLSMEGCLVSHVRLKDCGAQRDGNNSETNGGEKEDDKVSGHKQENGEMHDAKECIYTLEAVLSEKESAVGKSATGESCRLLQNISADHLDDANEQFVKHDPVRIQSSSPAACEILSVSCDSEGTDLENIRCCPVDNLKNGATSESKEDLATKNKEGNQHEFLVKWVGQSNIHNSWITESILKELAKRKLDNYKAKYGTALMNICEEQWMRPQRIIAQRVSKDGAKEALVKWCGLPYDECSWERLDEPVLKQSAHLIDELEQFESQTLDRNARNEPQKRMHNVQDFLPLVEQPKELKGGLLFPHQLEALNWLRKSWLKCKNVILADEMGLGKTVSACAFISVLCCEFKVNLPCLVLVPLSTIPNWLAEFVSWTPHLNVVEYHGCAKARSIIRQYEWKATSQNGSGNHSKAYKFNVLLTTYEMVLADSSHLRGVPWEVLIVDEGHRLKNSGSKLFGLLNTISFQHRVLLTGTPLQNNIGEMYNLLNFLQPESFSSLSTFEEKFSDLTTAEKVDELKKLVAPHMLRRLKKDAMQSIPPKTERMVPVELTSVQAEYYRAMLTKNYQILRNIGKGGAMQSLLNIVMQLRKVCNHPYLIPGTEPESGSAEFLREMRIKASDDKTS